MGDSFKLGEIRTFKNAHGEKPVYGQLSIQEREGLKDKVRSARGWAVVGFRVSLSREKGKDGVGDAGRSAVW